MKLCRPQDRGGKICHLLPALYGADPAEGGEAGQGVPYGDPVNPPEESLSPLAAFQRARSLPQQHIPGNNHTTANDWVGCCIFTSFTSFGFTESKQMNRSQFFVSEL